MIRRFGSVCHFQTLLTRHTPRALTVCMNVQHDASLIALEQLDVRVLATNHGWRRSLPVKHYKQRCTLKTEVTVNKTPSVSSIIFMYHCSIQGK